VCLIAPCLWASLLCPRPSSVFPPSNFVPISCIIQAPTENFHWFAHTHHLFFPPSKIVPISCIIQAHLLNTVIACLSTTTPTTIICFFPQQNCTHFMHHPGTPTENYHCLPLNNYTHHLFFFQQKCTHFMASSRHLLFFFQQNCTHFMHHPGTYCFFFQQKLYPFHASSRHTY